MSFRSKHSQKNKTDEDQHTDSQLALVSLLVSPCVLCSCAFERHLWPCDALHGSLHQPGAQVDGDKCPSCHPQPVPPEPALRLHPTSMQKKNIHTQPDQQLQSLNQKKMTGCSGAAWQAPGKGVGVSCGIPAQFTGSWQREELKKVRRRWRCLAWGQTPLWICATVGLPSSGTSPGGSGPSSIPSQLTLYSSSRCPARSWRRGQPARAKLRWSFHVGQYWSINTLWFTILKRKPSNSFPHIFSLTPIVQRIYKV